MRGPDVPCIPVAAYGTKVNTGVSFAGAFEKKMTEEGVKWSVLPESERKRRATTMPNFAKKWVADNEARGLPAGEVLEAYMDKLRTNGVKLVREWDRE